MRTSGQTIWNHIIAGRYGKQEQDMALKCKGMTYARYVHISRLFSLFYQAPHLNTLVDKKKARMIAMRAVQTILSNMER